MDNFSRKRVQGTPFVGPLRIIFRNCGTHRPSMSGYGHVLTVVQCHLSFWFCVPCTDPSRTERERRFAAEMINSKCGLDVAGSWLMTLKSKLESITGHWKQPCSSFCSWGSLPDLGVSVSRFVTMVKRELHFSPCIIHLLGWTNSWHIPA